MKCQVCEKESNNKRVCPYCFTPYPPEEVAAAARSGSHQRGPQVTPRSSQQAPRSSQSSGRASQQMPRVSGTAPDQPSALTLAVGRLRDVVMRQSPIVRWATAGILVILLAWMFTGEEQPTFESGEVPSNVIVTPMQQEEAVALIKHTRETALVDESSDEVFVSYPAASFPLRADGQIALAQQFARADEIVNGRKRRIFFYNPNGKVFAQADPVRGVTVVR
jgi:hypothetical protein